MKNKTLFHLFFFLLITQLQLGCVGKIEDVSAPQSTEFSRQKSFFNYAGIIRATPIAHNKVEIIFQRVQLTDTLNQSDSDFTYKLYINGDSDGLEIIPDTLSTHENGDYYYIANNLQRNVFYTFTVRAFNKGNSSESKGERTVKTKTFSDIVSDFMGVSKLELAKGQESTSVNVTFSRVGQPVANSDPYSPVRIDIYYDTDIPSLLSRPSPNISIPSNPISILGSNYSTTRSLAGLNPNTTYYFRVRAIHRLFKDNETNPANPYEREINTKILSIKTKASTDQIIHNPNDFIVKNASKEEGYSAIDVSWNAPSGTFFGYLLAYTRGSEDLSLLSVINNFPSTSNMTASGQIRITNGATKSYKVPSLTAGAVYKFRLLICRTLACSLATDGETESYNISSPIRVLPKLAAFTGIYRLLAPQNLGEYNLGTVTLEFAPPAVTTDWADQMKFYWKNNLGIDTEVTTAVTGLTLASTPPVNAFLATFSTIKIHGVNFCSDTPLEYCFNATPVLSRSPFPLLIPDSNYPSNNLSNDLRRCFYPEIKTPSIDNFPGLTNVVFGSTDPDTSETNVLTPLTHNVEATWNLPGDGLYNNYVIFWKKKNSVRFNFETAKTQYSAASPDQTCNATTTPGYCWQKVAATSSTLSATITSSNIDFGTYEFGILPLLESTTCSSIKSWGQSNTNIRYVTVPLPQATFQSWTRIFAIGPSKSALRPEVNPYAREAIDSHGVPFIPIVGSDNSFIDFLNPPGEIQTHPLSNPFDGILNSSEGAGSSQGIVSLAWNEVDLGIISDSLYRKKFAEVENNRSLRKYGYKVLRSEDNGLTWVDLTSGSSGLIKAISYDHFSRPSVNVANAPRMAFFTDYSVTQPTLDTLNERARVYWYKIEVYYDGKKINLTNPNSAVVRVTLPPPNMALVHRWMANRAQCLELGLDPDKDKHYSCHYEGLGAIPKSTPFVPGQTKIDMAGDLLVDRNELGCNYTRAPILKQTNFKDTPTMDFESVKTRSQNHSGCYKVGVSSLPGQIAPGTVAPTGNDKLLIGDCVGESSLIISRSFCTNPLRPSDSLTFFAPGYAGNLLNGQNSCQTRYSSLLSGVKADEDHHFLDANGAPNSGITDPFHWSKHNLVQAQPLSVFFKPNNTAWSPFPIPVESPLGTLSTLSGHNGFSSCAINLAAIHSGTQFSRWANLSLFQSSSSYGVSVTKKPSELVGPFYGALLGRPNSVSISETPIGRIMTSNNADLPPLTHIIPQIAEELCSTYKVDLVFQKGAASPVTTKSNLSKRLLRRREFVASTLWPETYTADQIRVLEGISPVAGVGSEFTSNACVHSQQNASAMSLWLPSPRQLSSTGLNGGISSSGGGLGSRCISRFGIQHLIGNIQEINTDRLFCDFSEAELRFGVATYNSNTREFTEGGQSFSLDPIQPVSDGWYINKKLKITNIFPETPVVTTLETLKPYVRPGTDAGYCSMVTTDIQHRKNLADRGWNSYETFINTFFKNLNEIIIQETSRIKDKGAVSSYRDGDGYFLDFGVSALSNSLRKSNTLSFPWLSPGGSSADDTLRNLNIYFSTLMGITMTCGNDLNTQNDHNCLDYKPKVVEETTYSLRTPFPDSNFLPATHPNADIANFFTGGSQIKNIGMTTLDNSFYNPALGNTRTFTRQDNSFTDGDFSYVDEIVVNLNNFNPNNFELYNENYEPGGNPETGKWSIISKSTADIPVSQSIDYYNADWELPRRSVLRYYSGGNSRTTATNELYNGRFSLEIKNEGTYQKAGVRCAVKLYEEEE